MCPFCKNEKFNTPQKIGGHLRYCSKKPAEVISSKTTAVEVDVVLESDYDMEFTEDFHDNFAYLSGEFIDSQRKFLSEDTIIALTAGRVKLLDNTYAQGNIYIYLQVAEYISWCNTLSEEKATKMIQLIKRISHINGLEIPLPAKFETIRANLLGSMLSKKSKIERVDFPLPTEIFGNQAVGKPVCVSAMCPLFEMLKRNLLDDSIVGENGEFFSLTSRQVYNDRGERVFSDWNTGLYFEEYERWIREYFNDESVVLILILISTDKTNLNKSGSEQAWPGYLGLGMKSIQLILCV